MSAAFAVCLAAVAAGCDERRTQLVPEGGDARRGEIALRQYACTTCHRIPGLVEARSDVGPALDGIARRRYLAGRVPNTPENMLRWIVAPESIKPGTAMPNLRVRDADALDMTAYLLSHGS
jgi:cytochrome c